MMDDWMRWAGTILLGWIAYEMRGLRRDVQQRVPYADCNRQMDEHREDIDELDRRVRRHGWKISALNEKEKKKRRK